MGQGQQLDTLQVHASYVLELAAAHAWSQIMYTICLPFQFCCVHHESVEKRASGLARLHSTWESVLQAESWQRDTTLPAGVRKAWNDLMADLAWNQGQIAREVYAAGQVAGWQHEDEELRIFSYLVFATPANTKFHLEDAFSHLADIVKRFARHGKLTR